MKRPLRRALLPCGILLLAGVLLEAIARTVTAYPPLLFAPDDSLLWTLASSQRGHPKSGLPPATVDGRGRRRASPPPRGVVSRVVVAGDSVTFGWGVGDGEDYCALLESSWNREAERGPTEVVNAGVPGYATWQILRVAAREVREERTRLALLVFTIDDFYRPADPGEEGRGWETRGLAWRSRLKRVALLGLLKERVVEPLLARLRTPRWTTESRKTVPFEEVWSRSAESVRRVVEEIREAGTIPVLVAIPERRLELDRGELAERLGALATESGAIFVDLYPRMREAGRSIEPYFLPVDGHPTAAGHAVIARTIEGALRASGRW